MLPPSLRWTASYFPRCWSPAVLCKLTISEACDRTGVEVGRLCPVWFICLYLNLTTRLLCTCFTVSCRVYKYLCYLWMCRCMPPDIRVFLQWHYLCESIYIFVCICDVCVCVFFCVFGVYVYVYMCAFICVRKGSYSVKCAYYLPPFLMCYTIFEKPTFLLLVLYYHKSNIDITTKCIVHLPL